jgi:hypothetical protein
MNSVFNCFSARVIPQLTRNLDKLIDPTNAISQIAGRWSSPDKGVPLPATSLPQIQVVALPSLRSLLPYLSVGLRFSVRANVSQILLQNRIALTTRYLLQQISSKIRGWNEDSF